MSLSSTIKGALLGSLLAVPSVVRAEVAADPNCWRTEEAEAARFEDFRLKLLVGALNCKNYLPGVATSYNRFVATKKDMVLANMYVVQAHFVREAGPAEGADQFASYETLAGNRYSTPIYDQAKCETIDTYIRMAATLSDADLVKMVAVLSPGPLPSGCKTAPRPAPVVAVIAAPPAPPAPAEVAVVTASSVAVAATPLLTPAVLTDTGPMTDAQRIAASTAATRRLLASRVSPIRSAAPAPVVATASTPVAVAAAPVAVVPATLLVPEVKPKPAKVELASVESANVEAAAPAQAVSPSAAQALADAAKALAAAVAAMQSTTR